MSAGHTPGPYVAHGREDGRGLSWTVGRPEIGRHFTLARVFRPAGDGPDVAKANALLFAAAPDLLNACEAMQQRITEAMDLERISPAQALEEMGVIVSAAISRATGEQP